MPWAGNDGSGITEINTQHEINSVFFVEDGKQVVSAGNEGMLRRWRVDDGCEVGEAIPADETRIYAATSSPDRRWFVCGMSRHAWVGVWDAQTHEKVLGVKGYTGMVRSVDVSPDSTKFAMGGSETSTAVSIWSMTTGERLVGPLQHDGWVVTVRFSPNGDRLAAATASDDAADARTARSIRIYNSDNGHLLTDIPFRLSKCISSSFAWSADGRQLLAASYSEVKHFDTSSGSLLRKWTVPGGGCSASVVISHNQKFAVVVAYKALSLWDTSTQQRIGSTIEHTSDIWSVVLSPNDECVATGERNGKVTLRRLHNILPDSYLAVNHLSQLPLMDVNDAALRFWKQDDLTRVEELLTEDIAHLYHHAQALAQRSLVRGRMKHWDMAMDDAKKSIEVQRSAIGYIAYAVAHVGNGDHESAIQVFDLVFTDGLTIENNFLLLIKAIILFECGKHHEAISRIHDLIDIVDDKSLCVIVRARMFFLHGCMLLTEGNRERAIEQLVRARDAMPFQTDPHLEVISLVFGWDFDNLDVAIRLQLQECIKPLEDHGDAAVQSKNLDEAILKYSTALSLNPSNPAGLLLKRSRARAMLGSWGNSLRDADEAIEADPLNPLGYERKHAALHGLQRYDEAINVFIRMLSLIEESDDQDIRQLGGKYISPSRSETIIDNVIDGVFKISPFILIDVNSGKLCDERKRATTFKSEPQFKELLSSMTEELDNKRIQRVVERYFQYVTLSHVWQGKEPSFQDVNLAGSVWDLDASPLTEKLQGFCGVVYSDGYRWAWSDTCCIDKMISTVLNQSLTMMYKWYEASAATYALLVDVASPSTPGDLTNSIWMTRAWTAQELLTVRAIRFYTRDWTPYLEDTRTNHKESPEIMQELADAMGIPRNTIIAFNPDDLTIREKLRLASTRNATLEEDVAYSLIGIFRSDIRPNYGEGHTALCHLLEEIVVRSGEVTVLAWTGKSSSYNTCLPATLAVYSQPPGTLSIIGDADMDVGVAELRNTLSQIDAILVHNRITRLPPARFANRRLHLPCVTFRVRRLNVREDGQGQGNHYRARVSGIGDVEFQTSDKLLLTEARKLMLVHPWIHELCDPLDDFTWGSASDEDYDSGTDSESSLSSYASPIEMMDEYTRALRLLVRLQQPFHGLLLQQQPTGEFKRIAAEHEIVVPGIEPRVNFTRDIHSAIVEIL